MNQIVKKTSSVLEDLNGLFLRVFGVIGFLIVVVQFLRGSDLAERWDRAIFGIGILVAIFFYVRIFFLKKITIRLDWFSWIASIVSITLGIAGIEIHDAPGKVTSATAWLGFGNEFSHGLWLGFGPYVFLLLLGITPFIWKIYRWNQLSRMVKGLITIPIGLSLILSIPSLWQDHRSLIDPASSEYVINELLATATGHWPLADFIPQYQTLYNFLVAPFSSFLNGIQLTQLGLVLMSIASLLAIGIGIILVRKCLPHHSWIIATALVVPFTCVTQFPVRTSYLGSISALLSGLPIRIFPGVVLLAFSIWLLTDETLKTRSRSIGFILLGMSSSLVVWNSQDFGIATMLMIFGVLLVIPKISPLKTLPMLFSWILGALLGFGLYPLIAALNGKTIHFKYFAYMSRQFASGVAAEGIRTPGPVLLIFPLILALVVSHLWILKIATDASEIQNKKSFYFNGLVGLFFSGWATLGFTYYVNRSYASGQMQILFLPIAIALGALIGVILKIHSEETPSNNNVFLAFPGCSFIPLSMVMAIPMASILLAPNPQIEMNRIQDGTIHPKWPKPSIQASINNAKEAVEFAKNHQVTVGFFGPSAHYVEKETGLPSVSILNSPFDMWMGPQTVKDTCNHIIELNPDFLVLSDEVAVVFGNKDQMICGTYSLLDMPGIQPGHFAKRIQ